MTLSQAFSVTGGVTAVIGSGGKSSLLRALARELPGTVILCTTTHILPFPGVPLLTAPTPEEVARALERSRVVCLGTPGPEGKLTAPALPLSLLSGLCDHVLVEADGSKRRPLKAHADHEPAVPPERRRVICVAGASGFGQEIAAAVHRPERFCALTDADPADPAIPELAARALAAERLADLVFLNQVDTPAGLPQARRFASALKGQGFLVAAGSLRARTCRVLAEG